MIKGNLFKLLVIFFIFLGELLYPSDVYASSPFEYPPEGFVLIRASIGVQLYRKDYTSGTPDYVQVIQLKRGAEIRLLYGGISPTAMEPGVFGGLDARFYSRSIEQYWEDILSVTSRAFCVTNGEFFNMYEYPTRLPFPLKVNGVILSGGYSKGEFTEERMMLEIWLDQVDIQPLTKLNFQNSSAPNILSGLLETSRKSPDKYVGRTFAGVKDQEGDGIFETLLIFSTQTARQADAAQTLRDFGAQKVLMLDGGSSTQLLCQGKSYIKTDRLIPNAIAVLDGTQPYYPKPKMRPPYSPKPGVQENLTENDMIKPVGSKHRLNNTTDHLIANKPTYPRINYQDAMLIPFFITIISLFLFKNAH
ncbi:MAG: phosphodiester glycosidase family protein [Anaerolineales bacterium]